jgi:hypothetical protein
MGNWLEDVGGSCCSPPQSPDYQGMAQQQYENNINTAKMGNPNVIGPYGSQTVTYGGPVEKNQTNFDPQAYLKANPDVASGFMPGEGNRTPMDPWFHYQNYGLKEGREYTPLSTATGNIPTIKQELSPEQKKLYDQQMTMKGLLGGLGIQGADALRGVVGKNLDLSGLPSMPGNADATRSKVYEAMMSRIGEDDARRRDELNSNMVAAGHRLGSKAYDDQMNLAGRQYNDARQQAVLASGQEASRDFGMDMNRRTQGLSEILTQRQTPLNEINALMSGSQVQNPFAMASPQGLNVQPAPFMQAGMAGGQYGTDVYNANMAMGSNIMGGLFDLGSASSPYWGSAASGIGSGISSAASGLMGLFSDRRLKRNIQRIGTHPSGIGWYEYDIFDRHEQGVMADEVEVVMPEAVIMHDSGYKMVDYGRLSHGV